MSKKLLIIIIGVFFLMMALMGGGFLILWKQMSSTVAQVQQQSGEVQPEEPVEEKEVTIGPMYKFDTMIVNLADQDGKRYLRVTMQLELSGPEVVAEIEKRLPQLLDTILMVLPAKQYADISTTQGKMTLRDEIIAKINAILKTGSVATLYFTEFVVQ
jgi:flagellar protein FliL